MMRSAKARSTPGKGGTGATLSLQEHRNKLKKKANQPKKGKGTKIQRQCRLIQLCCEDRQKAVNAKQEPNVDSDAACPPPSSPPPEKKKQKKKQSQNQSHRLLINLLAQKYTGSFLFWYEVISNSYITGHKHHDVGERRSECEKRGGKVVYKYRV